MNKRYSALFDEYRDDSVLARVREYARWTVPTAVAEVESTGQRSHVEGDFQSEGALLVTTLASKLVGLLFPTSHPFMRINIGEISEGEIEAGGASSTEVAGKLADTEQQASSRIFMNSSYSQVQEAMVSLIVTGNACVYRDTVEGRTVSYNLPSFATKRDGRGFVVDALVKERTFFGSLDKKAQEKLRKAQRGRFKPGEEYKIALDMYTRVLRSPRGGVVGYEVSTEIEGVRVGTPGWYRERECPWMFPVWRLVSGENYGRGLVETHAGGMGRLSVIGEALTLYTVESLKIVNLAGLSSASDIEALNRANNGEWVPANPGDVQAFESGATGKIQAVQAMLESQFNRLAPAFMYAGPTRDAERITAYELRQQALEAENSLGGAYSALADGFQLPLGYLLIGEVNQELLDALATTTDSSVSLTTGINALGRANEVQSLLTAIQTVAGIAEMLPADNRLDRDKVNDLIYAAHSVNTAQVKKSPEQLKMEAEAAQMEAEAQQNMTAAADLAAETNLGGM